MHECWWSQKQELSHEKHTLHRSHRRSRDVFDDSIDCAQHESSQSPTLVDVVREVTAQFLDPEAAVAAGDGTQTRLRDRTGTRERWACTSSTLRSWPTENSIPQKPETLVYESKNGRVRPVAAEFVRVSRRTGKRRATSKHSSSASVNF